MDQEDPCIWTKQLWNSASRTQKNWTNYIQQPKFICHPTLVERRLVTQNSTQFPYPPHLTTPGWGWEGLPYLLRIAWPRGSESLPLPGVTCGVLHNLVHEISRIDQSFLLWLPESTLSVWLPLSGVFLLRIKWESNLSGRGAQRNHLELLRNWEIELKLSTSENSWSRVFDYLLSTGKVIWYVVN